MGILWFLQASYREYNFYFQKNNFKVTPQKTPPHPKVIF